MLALETISTPSFLASTSKTPTLPVDSLRSALSPLAKLCKACLMKLVQKKSLNTICKSCVVVIQQWQACKSKKIVDLSKVKDNTKKAEKDCVEEVKTNNENPVPSPKRKFIFTVKEPKMNSARYSCSAASIYKTFVSLDITWCRYCGTTEGINWRPGPWGRRTLCNKHGCDYKGYGFAAKNPRLDLSSFSEEEIYDRERPIIQDFCFSCRESNSCEANILLMCHGCPRAYHNKCYKESIDFSVIIKSGKKWYCDSSCQANEAKQSVKIDLPRKCHMPFISAPSSVVRRNTVFETKSPLSKRPIRKEQKRQSTVSSLIPSHIVSAKLTLPTMKGEILTPTWKELSPSDLCPKLKLGHIVEEIDNQAYINRHLRYEKLEKHTRLLRPEALAVFQSAKKPFASSIQSRFLSTKASSQKEDVEMFEGIEGIDAKVITPEEAIKSFEGMKADEMSETIETTSKTVTEPLKIEEKPTGTGTKMQFKAETKRLLDIVANSLYSDKEVFVRELISNAADALEKLRYTQNASKQLVESTGDLCIKIFVDEARKLFVLQDNGIGMNKEELEENLGTIALSGSKKFLETMDGASSSKDKIIGQFGVGFYSSFMVGHKIEVFSKSATPNSQGYYWVSDGLGEFSMNEAENVTSGTKIIIHLKEEDLRYSKESTIEKIIKKYSNFVGFPVYLNGKQINTIQALWTMEKSGITLQQYNDFYKFISNDYSDPMLHVHYSTDAPINLRSLLFIPSSNTELFGVHKMAQKISLYARKVMIKAKTTELLPEWMRFVVGIVDSEDIPLNLSRELLQNNSLISQIKRVLTRKVLKWLEEISINNPEQYLKFYQEYSGMIKEGVCTDMEFKESVANLLRFESSNQEEKLVSLKEYTERMAQESKEIIYLRAPSRSIALSSPYYEPFKQKGIEVLFMYETIDEFVCEHLGTFNGKQVVSAEDAGSKLTHDNSNAEDKLPAEQADDLISWMTKLFDLKVKSIKASSRVTSHPALIVDHQSESIAKLMKMYNRQADVGSPPQNLEINLAHPIIKGLSTLKTQDEELAKDIAQLVYDNACINAGLIDDARPLVGKINTILERTIKANAK